PRAADRAAFGEDAAAAPRLPRARPARAAKWPPGKGDPRYRRIRLVPRGRPPALRISGPESREPGRSTPRAGGGSSSPVAAAPGCGARAAGLLQGGPVADRHGPNDTA